MWNNSSFLPTETWESKSHICQRMIPRFCNTPARRDFPGIYKDCVFERVGMGSRCWGTKLHILGDVMGCSEQHWSFKKSEANLGRNFEKCQSFFSLARTSVCRAGAAKKLPTTFSSLSKAFQNCQFPQNKKWTTKTLPLVSFPKRKIKKTQRKFYFSTEVEMSVGGGSFGEVFMFSFCFLFLFFPLFFHKDKKNSGEELTKKKIKVVLN